MTFPNLNFPSDLDIKPLTAPITSGSNTIDNGADPVDARFDDAAQQDAIRTYGIAGRVWEASYALLAYLRPPAHRHLAFDPPPFTAPPPHDRAPLTIIELGAGTGITAARLAPRLAPHRDTYLATDLADVCPLLAANLAGAPCVRVAPLAWGSAADAARALADAGAPTHIICSDLVYFPALHAPLLRTLLRLTDSAQTEVVLAYKLRSFAKEAPFWAAFGLWFAFAPVLCRRAQQPWARFSLAAVMDREDADADADADWEQTFVFVAQRRRGSHAWAVPESDDALLAGEGARGSATRKSDGTFEEMMLMALDVADEDT